MCRTAVPLADQSLRAEGGEAGVCAAVGGDDTDTAGKRQTQIETGQIGSFRCLLSHENLSVGRECLLTCCAAARLAEM